MVVISLGRHEDPVGQFIREHADEYLELPPSLPAARQAIAEARLDILFYCDLGMDPTSYTLAFSRLAPIQCVTWGHPSTTALPSMDYFVSSGLMETPEADEHYTERLGAAPLVDVLFLPPGAAAAAARPRLVRPSGDLHLYLCPQSIYKFHPEFDAILAGILRRDPLGRVVLIHWAYPLSDELLQRRFAATMPDVADRVIFIRRVQQGEFLKLLAVCDVLLDPLHFGGGVTGYEGLSLGIPIVTLPSRFLRGRLTAAMYAKMGVPECVVASPEQYVEVAVRLGTDADYRRQVRDAESSLPRARSTRTWLRSGRWRNSSARRWRKTTPSSTEFIFLRGTGFQPVAAEAGKVSDSS